MTLTTEEYMRAVELARLVTDKAEPSVYAMARALIQADGLRKAAVLSEVALSNFLENSDFQVGVGGNPIVVNGMLAYASHALSRLRDSLHPTPTGD